MQFIRKSLVRQFIFGILSALILVSVLSAFYQIQSVNKNAQQMLADEVTRMLDQLDDKISNILQSRNNQLNAIFTHPSTIEAIESIEVRGKLTEELPKLVPVSKYFKRLTQQDPNLVEVFFTTTKTWEYFDKDGKNEDPDYYINKRPFWDEFLAQNNHYVNDPYKDNDGNILMTFRSPLLNKTGELIGTAGIDLNLQQVNDELASLQSSYEGLQIFIVSNSGLMVNFPDMSEQMLAKDIGELKAEEIDEIYSERGAKGFAQLWRDLTDKNTLNHQLQWEHQAYQVYMRKFDKAVPEVHWHIAVMIPKSAIDEPLAKAIWENLLSLGVFVCILGIAIWWFTTWQLRPLKEVADAMNNISHGSADLTQRININRTDEIGQLANEFNVFVEKIQTLIKESNSSAQKFKSDAKSALESTQDTQQLIELQKNQLLSASSASVEMDQTSQHVAKRTDDISQIASSTKERVAAGVVMVQEATNKISQLAEQTIHAASVVKELESETHSIGEVVEVIRGIAEQTNLLALNAAIEAARAGEQGRGFAVVADEVRNLASRTQESTAHIQEIVAKLQNSANNATQVMVNGQTDAAQSKDLTMKISGVFEEFLTSMTNLEQHIMEIASSATQQSATAGEINQLIVGIDNLASDTVDKSLDLSQLIGTTDKASTELLENLGKFKI